MVKQFRHAGLVGSEVEPLIPQPHFPVVGAVLEKVRLGPNLVGAGDQPEETVLR